jgi:UDP-2,3-diacylglucosamine hydrolase
MTTLFISDLHLEASRPRISEQCLQFLQEECVAADALYILGDLFEYWIGDDDPQPLAEQIANALHSLAGLGVPVHFIRGNRDFLLGDAYAARAGFRILPDPCVISLYGHPTLLMHGDLLCTGDTEYQAFRRQSRDPDWQRDMLAQPIEVRIALAQRARAASAAHQQRLREERAAHGRANVAGAGSAGATGLAVDAGDVGREDITDVSADAVETTFARYGVDRLIHGHTHRPAIHWSAVAGKSCARIVLGDWYEQGSVLRVNPDGIVLTSL